MVIIFNEFVDKDGTTKVYIPIYLCINYDLIEVYISFFDIFGFFVRGKEDIIQGVPENASHFKMK